MPTFEYTGPTPGTRQRWSAQDQQGNIMELAPAQVSDPVDYVWHGGEVKGRTFEVGEHVTAEVNPDPTRFSEVPS